MFKNKKTEKTKQAQFQRNLFSRRDFIKISALAAGVLTLSGSLISQYLRTGLLKKVQETRFLMGTITNFTIIADDEEKAKAAVQSAYEGMKKLEDIMTRFQVNSELSRLNQDGFYSKPSSWFRDVIRKAIYYGEQTVGAFDITVAPVLAAYRRNRDNAADLSPSTVKKLEKLVDYRQISISADEIYYKRQGMAITLDGIAKGYIIDRGRDVLVQQGFGNVIVEAGGDMVVSGQNLARPWRIGIQSPSGKDELIAIAELQDCALATSGDYYNFFKADHSLNHILNPHTGVSPKDLSSVSVTAPTACDADALSTSIMVLGAEQGLAFVERLAKVEALLVTKAGEVICSSGFPVLS